LNALERLRRRTRRTESDHAAQTPFTVDGCECLVDGDFALLRVAGTGYTSPMALIAGLEAFEPLPQPGGDSEAGVWRIAFAVPADIADGSQELWLLDGEAYRAELRLPGAPPKARAVERPVPAHEEPSIDELAAAAAPLVEAVKDAKPAAPTEELDDPRARKLVEAWSEANDLRQKLSDREQELGEALKELIDARNDVEPLRERADALTTELATLNEDLKGSRRATKEARLRATQKAAELDAVRTELEAAQPRVEKAERARDRAEQEATQLRDQVQQLEAELAEARAAAPITADQSKLQDMVAEAQAARDRIEQERIEAEAELTRVQEEAHAERTRLEEQEKEADKLRAEIEKLENGNSRRRGFGRRAGDSELAKVRAELEERILTQQQRIAELEHEATSFAGRAEGAVADSLKERVARLESELDQTKATADDLRALLDSERELVAGARREAQDLKRQLAAAKANREAPVEDQPIIAKRVPVASSDDSDAAGPDSPPWSALDEELLARIEKAKALTS
jgi:DNA repair exonuclease SbcCD ATPase subunit